MVVEPVGNASFSRAYRRWLPFVRRAVARLEVRPADVDDVAQEVFIVMLRRLEGGEVADRAMRSWLYETARRVAGNHRRGRGRHARKLRSVREQSSRTPDEAAAWHEPLTRVCRALEGLTPAERVAFELAVVGGRPGREVARALGVKLHAAYTLIHRVRVRLEAAERGEEARGGRVAALWAELGRACRSLVGLAPAAVVALLVSLQGSTDGFEHVAPAGPRADAGPSVANRRHPTLAATERVASNTMPRRVIPLAPARRNATSDGAAVVPRDASAPSSAAGPRASAARAKARRAVPPTAPLERVGPRLGSAGSYPAGVAARSVAQTLAALVLPPASRPGIGGGARKPRPAPRRVGASAPRPSSARSSLATLHADPPRGDPDRGVFWRGRLVHPDGSPVADAAVRCRRRTRFGGRRRCFGRGAALPHTDARGRVVVGPLPPGEYELLPFESGAVASAASAVLIRVAQP